MGEIVGTVRAPQARVEPSREASGRRPMAAAHVQGRHHTDITVTDTVTRLHHSQRTVHVLIHLRTKYGFEINY